MAEIVIQHLDELVAQDYSRGAVRPPVVPPDLRAACVAALAVHDLLVRALGDWLVTHAEDRGFVTVAVSVEQLIGEVGANSVGLRKLVRRLGGGRDPQRASAIRVVGARFTDPTEPWRHSRVTP